MKYRALQRSCVVCGTVLTAAAVATGMLAISGSDTVTALPRIEFHQIQLQSVTASAALGTASPDNDQPDRHDLAPAMAPAAATGASDDPFVGVANALEIVGRAAVDVAGLVLAPLWYLAAPLTFFVATAYVNSITRPPAGPDMSGITGILHSLQYIIVWLEFPLRASSYLFPTPTTTTPASPAAAVPESGRSAVSAAVTVMAAAEAAVDRDDTPASGRSVRSRPQSHHPRRDRSATPNAAASSASQPAATDRHHARRSPTVQAPSGQSIARTERGSGIAGSQSGAGTGVP